MTTPSHSTALVAIRAGIVAGFGVCLVYPALIIFKPSAPVAAALSAAWGLWLAVASIGLGRLLALHRESYEAELAVRFNTIGGALVAAMLLVQIAVGETTQDSTPPELQAVWLGLDVAWDAYIGAGTALFAWAMWGHPRFGKVIGGTGLVLALALLVLNMVTFPTPPADAGLVDLGPFIGLWYLVVTILSWRSLGWARSRLAANG